MSTDDDLNARLSAAGDRWRAANKTIADVDLGYLEIPAEPVDVPVTPAGAAAPPRRRMRVLIAAGAGVAAAVAATVIAINLNGSSPTPHRVAGGIGANGLVGVDWRLVKVVGVPPTATALKVQARLMIDGKGQLTGTDGCNSLGSPVTITADTINLGSVVHTDMACVARAPGFAAQVSRVDAVLTGTLQWSVQGDELTLSKDGKAALVYRAAPAPTTDPKALVGVKWQLTGFAGSAADATASSPARPAYVIFDGKGNLSGDDGCNSMGG
ncbi:MAG: hypothetical protein QOD31_1369, partial [Pseudonocardiales bacterium]|nr:hypothetical protein [Pseudonocardiales bacterium]